MISPQKMTTGPGFGLSPQPDPPTRDRFVHLH